MQLERCHGRRFWRLGGGRAQGGGCEDDVGDEDDGLRLWSSGTRSHPVEDINLRETMSMAVKKMSEKTKTTTEMGMTGLGGGARVLSFTLWMSVHLRETRAVATKSSGEAGADSGGSGQTELECGE